MRHKRRVYFSLIWTATLLFLAFALSHASAFAAVRYNSNGKIAFTSAHNGILNIYAIDPDGTNQIQLTNDARVDDFPSWSPDGKRIAYLSQNASGSYVIKLMNADGTGQSELTASDYRVGARFNISWFPDGAKIAFPYGGDIYSINIDGTGRTNLTNNPVPALDTEPSVSRDGQSMAFTTNRYRSSALDIVIMNLDDKSLVRVPPLDGCCWSDFSPDLSRSGQLAFVTDDGIDGGWIFGEPGVTIVSGVDYDVDSPKWSPNGTKIAYGEYGTNGSQIFVHDNQTDENRQLTTGLSVNLHPSWQPTAPAGFDFDGDGRSDISVFRPSDRTWYLDRSFDAFDALQFGLPTDQITPADFDGDGETDIAVYRDGVWYWLNSSDGTLGVVQFGLTGDIPVPADYSGDGRDEIAIYRNGLWWMLDLASNQTSVVSFGLPADRPVPADYDGDGKVDQAVYRNGEWHLNRSSLGYMVINFGLSTDKPVVADYDGDGRADPAVYRDGTWYLDQSSQGFAAFNWGLSTDVPVPADYDGDGRADPAVFRSGAWYLLQSTSGASIRDFGHSDDDPLQAAFVH